MDRWKVLSIILSMLLMTLLLYCLNQSEKIKHSQIEFYDNMCKIDTLMVHKFNFELNCQTMGMYAKDVKCCTKSEQFLLSEIVKDRPVLVFRYSDINCNTCIEAEIEALQKVFKTDLQSILILCSYNIDKDFYTFKKVNKINCPIYKIDHNSFDWAPEEYKNPYCFVLHPTLKVSDIYVPDKSFPQMNENYLNGIKRFICKSK